MCCLLSIIIQAYRASSFIVEVILFPLVIIFYLINVMTRGKGHNTIN